jgi:hypothetical protein
LVPFLVGGTLLVWLAIGLLSVPSDNYTVEDMGRGLFTFFATICLIGSACLLIPACILFAEAIRSVSSSPRSRRVLRVIAVLLIPVAAVARMIALLSFDFTEGGWTAEGVTPEPDAVTAVQREAGYTLVVAAYAFAAAVMIFFQTWRIARTRQGTGPADDPTF